MRLCITASVTELLEAPGKETKTRTIRQISQRIDDELSTLYKNFPI